MNNLTKLFKFYYEEGFVKNTDKSKGYQYYCIKLMHSLLKEDNINYDLMPIFNNEYADQLKSISSDMLKGLNSFDGFKQMATKVYERDFNINEKEGTPNFNLEYKNEVIKYKYINENGNIYDKYSEEVVVENLNNEDRIIKVNEFKDKLSVYYNNSKIINGKSKDEIHNAALGKLVFNSVTEKMCDKYFKSLNNPIGALKDFVIVDDSLNTSIFNDVRSLFSKYLANAIRDNEFIEKEIEIASKTNNAKDYFTNLGTYFQTREDKKELIGKFNNKIFQELVEKCCNQLKTEENYDFLFNQFEKIDGFEKFLPIDDDFKTVLNDDKANDQYTEENKIRALIKELDDENDAQLINDLYYANSIIVRATSTSMNKISAIAEDVGKLYDREVLNQAVKILHDEVDEKFVVDNSTCEFNGTNDELGNHIKNMFDEDIKISPEYIKKVENMIKEMKDSNIFMPNVNVSEDGEKLYSFYALKAKKIEVTNKITECFNNDGTRNDKVLDKDNLHTYIEEYKKLDNAYTKLLNEVNEIQKDGRISANISSARSLFTPAKYRMDYVGATRLNALNFVAKFCHDNYLTVKDYLNNPAKGLYNSFVKQFNENPITKIIKNNNLNIFEKYEEYNRQAKDIDKFYGLFLMNLTSNFTRSIGALLYSDEKNCINVMASLEPTLVLVNRLNVFYDEYHKFFNDNNKEANMTNMLFYKDDASAIDLANHIKDGIDLLNLKDIKRTDIASYIKDNYTVEEIAKKYIEIKELIDNNKNKPNYDKTVEDIFMKVHRTLVDKKVYSTQVMNELNKIRNGEASYFSRMLKQIESGNYPTTKTNFKDFYINFNKLANEMLNPEITGNVSKDIFNRAKAFYDVKIIDFYLNKFKEWVEQNIDIDTINTELIANNKDYQYDTKTKEGLFKIMDAIAENNPDFEFEKKDMPSDHFEQLYDKAVMSMSKYPDGLKEFKENNQELDEDFLEELDDIFIGAEHEETEYLMDIEEPLQEQTNNLVYKQNTIKYVEKNPDLAKAIEYGKDIAFFDPLENLDNNDKCLELIDEFTVSKKTQDNIIEIYNTMKKYNMLVGFTKNSEEGTKAYAFKKYALEYEKYQKALKDNDVETVREIKNNYSDLFNEYNELLDMCQDSFKQDGLHVPTNVSIGRESMFPMEYTFRVQEHNQLNIIYCLANECQKHNIDFEWAVKNPSDFAKRLLNESMEVEKNAYVGKDFAETYLNIINDKSMINFGMNRAIECLITLEDDDSIRAKNGAIYTIFDGFVGAHGTLNKPFKICNGNPGKIQSEFVGHDYNSLKAFISGYDPNRFFEFFPNELNNATGKQFEPYNDYENNILEGNKSLDEILNDVVEKLSKVILKVNNTVMPSAKYSEISRLYIAASMYINDYLNIKDLESSNTLDVLNAKNFIANPAGVVKKHILEHYNQEFNNARTKKMHSGLVDDLLIEFDLINNDSITKGKLYADSINQMNIEQLINEFNYVKSLGDNGIKSNNLFKMLTIAKKANAEMHSHGLVGKVFSSDYKHAKEIEDNIHNMIKNALNDKFYEDVVYEGIDNTLNIATLENELKIKERTNDIINLDAKKEIDKLFEVGNISRLSVAQRAIYQKAQNCPNGSIDLDEDEIISYNEAIEVLKGKPLNEDLLKETMNLYNDVAKVSKMSTLDEGEKTKIDNVLKTLTTELNKRGIGDYFRDLYNENHKNAKDICDTLNIERNKRVNIKEQVIVNEEDPVNFIYKNVTKEKEIELNKKKVIIEEINTDTVKKENAQEIISNINNDLINTLDEQIKPNDLMKNPGYIVDEDEKIELADPNDFTINQK